MIRLKITIPVKTKKVKSRLVFFPESRAKSRKNKNCKTLYSVLGLNNNAGIITSPVKNKALALKILSYFVSFMLFGQSVKKRVPNQLLDTPFMTYWLFVSITFSAFAAALDAAKGSFAL